MALNSRNKNVFNRDDSESRWTSEPFAARLVQELSSSIDASLLHNVSRLAMLNHIGVGPIVSVAPVAGKTETSASSASSGVAATLAGSGDDAPVAGIPTTQITPTDTLYVTQWHLTRMGDLATVWDDYTGAGVNVGVYDDGIEIPHQDLNDNYDASRHFVLSDGTVVDGAPEGGNSHGTAVAGLIGAELNGEGVVGVAYGSSLTSIPIFNEGGGVFINAATPTGFFASLRTLAFDVVNHSWGSTPGFFSSQNRNVAGSFAQQTSAGWEFQAANGRDGLGTIVVKSAGNEQRNANGESSNSTRQIINVAAVSDLNRAASYSNHGTNILISGLGSEFASNGGLGITTTDRLGAAGYNTRAAPTTANDYTDNFGGTSAAAPIVAGVVTLMLDANENLGWRDVQNIVALSGTLTGSAIGASAPGTYENDTWKINDAANFNGGGMHFHTNYGFGVINAYNAVRLSEVWSLFSPTPQVSNNESSYTIAEGLSLAIPDAGGGSVSESFTVNDDFQIENLQLTFNITHSYYGDVFITLTAPDGTVYILDDNTAGSSSAADGGLTWTFGVNALRGQSLRGTWTMTFSDTAGQDVGTVTGYSATFYGTPASANDTYHFTNEFETLAALDPSRRIVVDTDGGTDWLNFAAVAGNLNVNLAEGASSTLNTNPFISIAVGSQIENAIGGDGSDSLRGNDLANTLYGMRGNDALYGFGGNDTLAGGRGSDYLDGGTGSDTATYAEADGGVTVMLEQSGYQDTGGAGSDELVGIENLTGSAFDDNLRGDFANNIFYGGAGADRLFGVGGTNRLYGEAGDDILLGGRGIDTLDGGDGADFVSFEAAPAGVTVTLASTGPQNIGSGFSVRLSNFENLIGSFNGDTLTGDSADNMIYGLPGDDVIEGGGGNDTIGGGDGIDTASYAGATAAVVVDLSIANYAQNTLGAGTDTIFGVEALLGSRFGDTLIAGTLSGTVDSIVTLGTDVTRDSQATAFFLDAFSLAANGNIDQSTTLPHVTVNATAVGGFEWYSFTIKQSGTVTIDIDGASFDTMVELIDSSGNQISVGDDGGLDPGSSTFTDSNLSVFLSTPGTYFIRINEYFFNPISAGASYTFHLSIPSGALTAAAIAGGLGDDILVAGGGDDTLDGGGGNDTASYADASAGVTVSLAMQGVAQATVGAGNDTLVGIERLIGSNFNDTLTGDAQVNILTGGLGDDTYVIGTGDRVVELSGGGSDTARSVRDLRLDNNVENGVLDGTGAIDGTGNALDNVLTGNAAINRLYGGGGDDTLYGLGGNDYLDGGAGSDVMNGGSGDDIYIVNDAGDIVVEAAGSGSGTDLVRAGVTFTLGTAVENLTLVGGARVGTGNELGNRIQGSAGNDVLSGLAGADNLVGAEGNDTLSGGNDNDSLTGGAGKDTMTGGLGTDQFRFDDGDTGSTNFQADVITDFSRTQGDRINLSLIDAIPSTVADNAFTFIGTGAFSNVAGQLRYTTAQGDTFIQGDLDGNGTIDLVIRLTGIHALLATDFVL